MDVLRGQTPGVVRKEIWAHLLTYNLVRTILWEAAIRQNAPPGRVSFKATIQHVTSNRDLFANHSPLRVCPPLESLLDLVARQIVPWRPNRIEPRVRKRRPKNYPLMTRPRSELKAAAGG
jgi:hypothetical protein